CARLVLWPRDQGLAANTPAANHWLLADSQQPVAAPVQRACKPDSVPPSREAAVICLDAVSPRRSSSQPGSHNGPGTHPPLFGLAPGGVCLAALLPGRRCALTAPFHPYPRNAGGMFLWHFPSAHAAQVLPGTLPGGVRTFLCSELQRLPGPLDQP